MGEAQLEPSQVLSALIGACFGSLGWLFVGLYINQRTTRSAARSAARAVYFELLLNRANVELAATYGETMPLSRSSYEQLLPQLASLLSANDLSTVAGAYISHVGYEQVRQGRDHPEDARRAALASILGAQVAALERLGEVAFTSAERGDLRLAGDLQPGRD